MAPEPVDSVDARRRAMLAAIFENLDADEAGDKRPMVGTRREQRAAVRDTWTDEQWETRRWQHAVTSPWAAAAGTWAYGACAHYLATVDGAPSTTVVLTGLGAVAVTWAVRIGLHRVFVPRWSMRYWLAGAVASAWSMLTAVAGPSWLLAGALMLATVTLSAAWYRVHRLIAPEPAGPEQVLEPEPQDLMAQLAALWDTYLGAPRKSLAGSVLTGGEKVRNGIRFEIHLDPELHHYGDLATDAIKARLAAVIGHLGFCLDDIQIEPHDSGDHSKGVVTFLTNQPLKAGVPYRGPRYDKGFIAVGPWADGDGWGAVQLADHHASVFNILVTGDPGKGKSVCLENLGMSALWSSCWKVLFLDGSENADSSSLLNDYMTASEAGVAGAWRQLEAVKEYLATRGDENDALPPDVRGVDPSPARMGLLWIIDELHRLCYLDPRFAAELAQVVRLGRKRGLAVAAATQGVDLKEDFGNVTALRDILTSMNIVAFYSSSTYAHTMISGTKIAPNTLPTAGGYAYLKSPRMRAALKLRTDYSQDMTPWAREIPEYPWDEAGYLAVKRYLDSKGTQEEARRARREAAEQRFQVRLERLRQGLPGTPEEQNDEQTTEGPFSDLMGRMPRELTVADIVSAAPEADGRIVLDATHDAILALIGQGVSDTRDIVKWVRAGRAISERTIKRKLAELVELGLVARPERQGRYRLVQGVAS